MGLSILAVLDEQHAKADGDAEQSGSFSALRDFDFPLLLAL